MKLTLRKWDSNFFKKKIGSLIINEKDIKKKTILNKLYNVLRKAKRGRYRYILAKFPISLSPIVDPLESLNFYLRDILLEFSRKGEGDYDKTEFIKEINYDELRKVAEWAECIFRNSFFYNDPFFDEKLVDKMHRAWITNLFNKRKTCFLTYRVEKEIVGFLICERKKSNWNIVLFGVSPNFRRKNIATILLKRMIRMVSRSNLITVHTQLKNLPAIRCYLKCGFDFSNSFLTLSKILEDEKPIFDITQKISQQ